MKIEHEGDGSSLLYIIFFSLSNLELCVYYVMGILQLLNLLVLNCTCPMLYSDVKLVLCVHPSPPFPLPPPLPMTNKGPAPDQWGARNCRQAVCRTQKLLGGAPLRKFTYKCDLCGLNTVNQRNIHYQFKRTGKPHVSWKTLQVFWGRAQFHGSTLLFCMSLVLKTVYTTPSNSLIYCSVSLYVINCSSLKECAIGYKLLQIICHSNVFKIYFRLK
jgi:hypothetical protein